MSFHRKKSKITFYYAINGIPIDREYEMHDLGVLFDSKLTFVRHIDYIIAKAHSMLGFIMRICSEFNNSLVLKSLYFAYA